MAGKREKLEDMSWLSRMAEQQMTKARLQGQLQGLEEEGKPLPDPASDAFVSAGDAIGFLIMADAGFCPKRSAPKSKLGPARHSIQPH